jgi:hypothetical protein
MVLMLSERKLRPIPKLADLTPPPLAAAAPIAFEDEEMDGDGVLSIEEALRRFQIAVGQAREAQLKWIEALGPPEGWVRLQDVERELAARNGGRMSEITRTELDARFDAIGAKIDLRAASLEAKMDGFIITQFERNRSFEQQFASVEKQSEKSAGDLKGIKEDVRKTSDDVHTIRRNLARYSGGFAVAAAIAGLVGGVVIKMLF